jgi:hypothetical protein
MLSISEYLLSLLPRNISNIAYPCLRKSYYSYYRLKRIITYHFSREYNRIKKLKNIYKGKRCFVVGNGPSIKRQDLTVLKDEITFVTNWFAIHEEYEEINPNFYCIISHEIFGGWEEPSFNKELYDLMMTKTTHTTKFFPFIFKNYVVSNYLFENHNTYYVLYEPKASKQTWITGQINLNLSKPLLSSQNVVSGLCLPLAYHMGFREIYLLGCDCDYGISHEGDKRNYFYDFNKSMPGPSHEFLMNSWGDGGPMFQSYDIVKRMFERKACSIFNATKGGRLEIFPRVDFGSLF